MAKKITYKRGRPKRGQISLTKESIVLAAWNMINRDGWENFGLGGLAANLGIRTPSLYNHIQSLEHLREELRCFGLQILFERLEENFQFGIAEKDKLQNFLFTYRNFAKAYPEFYHLTVLSTENSETLKPLGDKILKLTLEAFGFFQLDEEMTHKIRLVRSMLHGFVDLERLGGFGLPESVETSFQILVDSVISGRLWNR
ncbi:TetR-like C-terminal domain-containing protein [Leptospira sp. 96542]|nr:TetR-like C-terminal domain-containing protein [Leptospira sp. 96542]